MPFRGLKRLGVGKPSDEELNQALWKVLERIAVPLTEVRGLKPSEVRPWVALLTSQMIGALVLQIAGRLDFLQTGAQTLLRMMLAQCLAPAVSKNVKAARKSNSKGVCEMVRIEKQGAVWTVDPQPVCGSTQRDGSRQRGRAGGGLSRNSTPDDSASVAVLWGEGGAFCAGWDLKFASTTRRSRCLPAPCRRWPGLPDRRQPRAARSARADAT
jgi:hypothetical protein